MIPSLGDLFKFRTGRWWPQTSSRASTTFRSLFLSQEVINSRSTYVCRSSVFQLVCHYSVIKPQNHLKWRKAKERRENISPIVNQSHFLASVLPIYFLRFSEPIWLQFLFLPGFPVYFSGFWGDFSVCRSDLVLLFPTLCRIWGSDGVVPPLDEAFRFEQLDGPAWVEPQRPPRSTNLGGRGRDPVELPTMRTKHIRTWCLRHRTRPKCVPSLYYHERQPCWRSHATFFSAPRANFGAPQLDFQKELRNSNSIFGKRKS